MLPSRRILDPVKLVLPEDEALSSSTDYAAYLEAWCDWSLLKLKDGATPTVFTVQQLTTRQKMARESYAGRNLAQAIFTARCGLLDVSGLDVLKPDGSTVTFGRPERRREGELGDLVPESWFEEAHLTQNQLAALSMAIIAVSEVNGPLLKQLATLFGAAT